MPDYIAIGDIHGMAKLLDELLLALPTEGDLVFLGDYLDRGPDSSGVITRLIQLSHERSCHFLRGNHEEMLLASLDEGNADTWSHWLGNGGSQTLDNYGGVLPPSHLEFLRQTQWYFSTENYFFVHAGVEPGRKPEETSPEEMIWIREPFLRSNYDWGRLVVHGHTPRISGRPQIRANRINIDTGAVYGGSLTALLLPERSFISRP